MNSGLIFYLVPLMNAGRKFFRTVASKKPLTTWPDRLKVYSQLGVTEVPQGNYQLLIKPRRPAAQKGPGRVAFFSLLWPLWPKEKKCELLSRKSA